MLFSLWASLVAQTVKNLPAVWEIWVLIPWRRDWHPTPEWSIVIARHKCAWGGKGDK